MKTLMFITVLFVFSVANVFGLATDQKKIQKVVVIEEEENGHHFGIVVATPDQETLEKYGLDGGAEVLKVYKGSDAEKAGLKEHDIILKIDGERIDEPEDLKEYFADLDNEKEVDIVVNRQGKELIFTAHVTPLEPEDREVILRLKANKLRAKADSLLKGLKLKMKDLPVVMTKGGYLGVEAEMLNKQLAEYFGVEFGVLVKKVIKDSPAEKAGIKAGDVIYKINQKEIHDVQDLVRTVNFYDPGDQVKVYLKRKGKQKEISVKLGKKEGIPADEENFEWFPKIPPKRFELKKFKGHLWHPDEEEEMPEFDEEREIYRF